LEAAAVLGEGAANTDREAAPVKEEAACTDEGTPGVDAGVVHDRVDSTDTPVIVKGAEAAKEPPASVGLPPLPAKARLSEPVSPKKITANTTVTLQNIPKKCSRDQLTERLDEAGFHVDVDFVYVPVDLKSRCNMGSAIINFRTEAARARFAERFHEASAKEVFPGLGTARQVCEVSPAPVQGRDANVQKLQRSGLLMSLLASRPEWMPRLFDEEGAPVKFPEQPEEE